MIVTLLVSSNNPPGMPPPPHAVPPRQSSKTSGVLHDLTDKPLEGQLADQQLDALLILSDLPKRHGSGPEVVGLLHRAGDRCRLPSQFCRQLLARGLSNPNPNFVDSQIPISLSLE
ncbi:hypothetical protein RJ640_001921 [Escallonia rubra]|uniref:Uncharacterized protein n=1 Tax=Escallonia rubra TaxID=112253 RepID=A0AA88R0X4_9ASTE|nr:hypothetical protein RJ640_001921 [Escallonia rubra]